MHVYMCGSTIGAPTTFDRVPKHLQAYFYAHRAIRNGTLTCVICTHFRGPVLLVLKYFRCTRSISIDVITSQVSVGLVGHVTICTMEHGGPI